METVQQTEEEIEKAYIVADELERRRKLSYPRYTDKDLVEAFSPLVETIQAKIEDWQEEQRKITQKTKRAFCETTCRSWLPPSPLAWASINPTCGL